MRALALLAVVLVAGCLRSTAYHCGNDTDCQKGGAQGTCEPESFCSFPDPDCASGKKFGDLSGPLSNTCVGGGGGDGGVDIDGSPGIDANNDIDGDGVPNATDNCAAIANADQGNEDGDKFGDVCDPCPPVGDDNPPDTDGDGVADACDPSPATPGDHIALFEGFHQTGVPATFTTVGPWTSIGDSVQVAASGTTLASFAINASTTKHESVVAGITLVSFNAGAGFSGTGTIDDATQNLAASASCSMFHTSQPAQGLLVSDRTQNPTAAFAQAMMTGATYTMTLRRDLTVFGCNGTTTGGMANVAMTTAVDSTPSYQGVYAFEASIQVHWFMVLSNP
jgi:hypothetical protein